MKTKKLIALYSIAILLAVALFVYLIAPYNKEAYRKKAIQRAKDAYEKAYVDYDEYLQGRVCGEVRFDCLPESLDKSWQVIPTKDHIEDLDITPRVEKKYQLAIQAWNKTYREYIKKHPKATRREEMLISSLDKDFFEKVERRKFMDEMEQELAKEFPGFWRGVPKKVRYRWIRRAMNKAKRFGYDPKQNQPMVELCARIGLDFDKDPKWEYITKFIAKKEVNLVRANDYIDWTIFGKTHDRTGTRITDWSMRGAHPGLPYPKKPYPRLNENVEVYYK